MWASLRFPHPLSARVNAVLAPIIEAQDPFGLAAVLAYLLSALVASGALALSMGVLTPSHGLYPVAAWAFRHLGAVLWGIAAGAGFMSARKLPRVLAYSIIAEVVLFYQWGRFGFPGSFFPWNLLIHVILAGLLALPSALAQVLQWNAKRTA